MINLKQRLKARKKSEQGFTLVELIVVLVILAILAAFTIPAMLGFVEDGKEKAAIAEARETYVAAQAVLVEIVAEEGANSWLKLFPDYILGKNTSTDKPEIREKYLSLIGNDINGELEEVKMEQKADSEGWFYYTGKIESVKYRPKNADFVILIKAGDIAEIIKD